jgi:hypothetical protein
MDLGPDLYTLTDSIETRWASPENPTGAKGAGAQTHGGRKGRPSFPVKSGERVVLAESSGRSGIVRRIWMTITDPAPPATVRGVVMEFYWDGAATPAIRVPLGDFFGQGLGRLTAFESVFFSNPEGRSFNCALPMPFRTGFKIAFANESGCDIDHLFYDVNFTLGDKIESPSYLHAYWNRENPTTLMRDFAILPKIEGRGRYLGANFSVIVDNKTYARAWWGEGECKVFLDGDTDHATLLGTGVEDYIGTAWGQGKYAHRYQGCPIAENEGERGFYTFYRYHVPDPIYFQREIRVTIQQIGGAFPSFVHAMRDQGVKLIGAGPDTGAPLDMDMVGKPSAIFERQDDWASCCYFYLNRPENSLPALAALNHRTGGLPTA